MPRAQPVRLSHPVPVGVAEIRTTCLKLERRYDETTVVDIYGKRFEHTDTNTLARA